MYINFLIEPQCYRSDRGGTLNAQRLGPYKIRQKNELFNATCVAAAYPQFLLNTLHRRTLKLTSPQAGNQSPSLSSNTAILVVSEYEKLLQHVLHTAIEL